MDEPRVIEDAYGYLRGHTRGELRFDERVAALRYVIGPAGQLVAPVTYAMLEAVDTVLFVPEYAEGAMELQVSLARLDPDGPDGALTDRWRIYHGNPQDGYWALMDLDAARFEGSIIDGVALVRANPLAPTESRLCRRINEHHRQELRRVCRHLARADVEHPTLVGVDRVGFDVRRRFDVIRLPAPAPMNTADDVERVMEKMIAESHQPSAIRDEESD
ncbi:MAG: DUF2470 domain-containing protein [Planctomycetota bacterium]|jgi:hypothetical protein